MNKKLIKRYILLSIPFVSGFILITMGIYNIVSSLLFFIGGYVFVKNIGDYRIIRKNIRKSNNDTMNNVIKIDSINDRENDRKIINSYDNLGLCDIDIAINKDKDNDIIECKYQYKHKNGDSINGIKNTRRHVKIRRRY